MQISHKGRLRPPAIAGGKRHDEGNDNRCTLRNGRRGGTGDGPELPILEALLPRSADKGAGATTRQVGIQRLVVSQTEPDDRKIAGLCPCVYMGTFLMYTTSMANI